MKRILHQADGVDGRTAFHRQHRLKIPRRRAARSYPPYQAPLIFVFGGAATALCIYGVMNSHQLGWIAFFLLAANACWGAQGAAIPTLLQHYARPKAVGSAYGLINGIGNLFSAFVPMAMGMVMASRARCPRALRC